jgi:hypothetical protein
VVFTEGLLGERASQSRLGLSELNRGIVPRSRRSASLGQWLEVEEKCAPALAS